MRMNDELNGWIPQMMTFIMWLNVARRMLWLTASAVKWWLQSSDDNAEMHLTRSDCSRDRHCCCHCCRLERSDKCSVFVSQCRVGCCCGSSCCWYLLKNRRELINVKFHRLACDCLFTYPYPNRRPQSNRSRRCRSSHNCFSMVVHEILCHLNLSMMACCPC